MSESFEKHMRRRAPVGPVPTLGALMRNGSGGWVWLYCDRCMHHHPVTLAQFAILWGMNASSDLLRRNAACRRCGHRGASTTLPSWAGNLTGWDPFPREGWTDQPAGISE